MNRMLVDYLPDRLRAVRELREFQNAAQPEIDRLWESIESSLDEIFVASAGEYGIKRWERLFGLQEKVSGGLEARRFKLLLRLGERLPFSENALRCLLDVLCGPGNSVVLVDPVNYLLRVKVAVGVRQNLDAVRDMLNRITPANLIISLELLFNTYGLYSDQRHVEMTAKTHYQLREEVD